MFCVLFFFQGLDVLCPIFFQYNLFEIVQVYFLFNAVSGGVAFTALLPIQHVPFSLSIKVPPLTNIFAISIIPVHYFLQFHLGLDDILALEKIDYLSLSIHRFPIALHIGGRTS